jgi:aminopeptidase N
VGLLNKNSYEKAGWVLHMLRHEMGDNQFQDCLQAFYAKYKFSNALTEDFKEVAEQISGKEYDVFFDQWFYQPGHPVLSTQWKKRGRKLSLTITQHQYQHIFQFPLDIEIIGRSGKNLKLTLDIVQQEQSFSLDLPFVAKEIQLDPDSWLLYENHL